MSRKAPPSPPPSSPAKRRRAKKADLDGAGAIAPGTGATAVGSGGVHVGGDNTAPINIYQTLIRQAERPGATPADLRKAYLAWIGLRANELPLFAGDSGKPAQLSSVYTALLTEARQRSDAHLPAADRGKREMAGQDADLQSALEALDQEQCLVLMGGPGSGKTTFLNFVALCMTGELLGLDVNLGRLRAPLPPDPDQPNRPPKPQPWSHKALLPVRVVLRDFAADLPPPGTAVTADALWNFIVKQLPGQLQPYADDLQAELLQNGGLILLDGLDEVPDALQRREQVKQAVQEFAAIHRACRFLVTSRTYAYQRQDWKLKGFAERELLPFTRGQIERFIDTWYAHMVGLERLSENDATGRGELLKRATRRAELAELAERPLLLTLMARLQTRGGGSLPENREELYAQSVTMLLDEWEGFKLRRDASGTPVVNEPSLGEWLNASQENIRRELDQLAYLSHLNQPTLVGTADIRQADLIAALMAASKGRADARLMRLEEYLRDRAGLLTAHGEGLYQFPHRSFQEYLAACHLARFDFPDTLSRLARTDPNRWREVTLLAAARFKGAPSSTWELVEELCAKDEAPVAGAPEPAVEAQWGALLAGQVLAETGLAAQNPNLQQRHERKRQRVRDWQLCLLRSTVLPARERALAGDLLAALGDTRRHLLDVDHLRFSLVPGGPFWMGGANDEDALLHRNPSLHHDYWIAQTPTSVAQFRQFVESSGYAKHGPQSLHDPDNRPVCWVSLHDAQAFCAWLTRRWRDKLPRGWCVTLASGAEWEKAARGGAQIPVAVQVATAVDKAFESAASALHDNPLPHREYPWGNDFLPDNANVDMNVGGTSTPGCFADGASPYACEDMAGNVWEWTDDVLGDSQLVCGGSWRNHRDPARCAFRGGGFAGSRSYYVGFRVVLRSAPVLDSEL